MGKTKSVGELPEVSFWRKTIDLHFGKDAIAMPKGLDRAKVGSKVSVTLEAEVTGMNLEPDSTRLTLKVGEVQIAHKRGGSIKDALDDISDKRKM